MCMIRFVVAVAVLILATACNTVTPAPGADQVRVTLAQGDVANCNVAGNIKVPLNADGVPSVTNPDTEFRNQTIGLGGNTAFVTLGSVAFPKQGIAYRCP